MKFKKEYPIVFLILLVTLFSLSSCLKNSGPDTGSIVSALTVIHASPNSPAFEFVLDNQRVQEFTFAEKRIKYFTAFSGSHFARIYEVENFYSPLYELELNLYQGKYYSLFIGGKKGALNSLMIEDDLTSPERGNAKIRFVHLSPDAPSLDFEISADSLLASNKVYKEYTSFQEVKAGDYHASIKSHAKGSIDFPFDLKLEDGKIYTIWAKGLLNTDVEEEAFGNSIIIHNIN